MATKVRSHLTSKLSEDHLREIGRVAAEWSALEFAMLDSIAICGEVPLVKTIMLCGPAAFASWTDILLVVSANKKHGHKYEPLRKLIGLLLKLLRLRNYMVHANWQHQDGVDSGLFASVVNPGPETAKGLGVPKRGQDIILTVHWTVIQMRLVADLIAESRAVLHEIVDRKPSTSIAELVEQTQSYHSILARIQSMLDRLPDPFQK